MYLGKQQRDPTAHGEMVAIRRFLAQHGPEALRGTTLYTSGDPCAMCMGAIVWCGLPRVVFAASLQQLATKIDQITITCTQVADWSAFRQIAITGGVLAEEALALFPPGDRPSEQGTGKRLARPTARAAARWDAAVAARAPAALPGRAPWCTLPAIPGPRPEHPPRAPGDRGTACAGRRSRRADRADRQGAVA
ncbi:nucleoside deaminase [Methylobacterium radiotolerans]|uniref:nucleoside deaminase n=1 Tax=Methylobacterium radiotolerans TaxID=31998 RepID=UPI0034D15DC3